MLCSVAFRSVVRVNLLRASLVTLACLLTCSLTSFHAKPRKTRARQSRSRQLPNPALLAHCLSTSFKLWPLLARPPVGAMANAIMAQAPQVAPRCLQFPLAALCSAVWHSEALLGSNKIRAGLVTLACLLTCSLTSFHAKPRRTRNPSGNNFKFWRPSTPPKKGSGIVLVGLARPEMSDQIEHQILVHKCVRQHMTH